VRGLQPASTLLAGTVINSQYERTDSAQMVLNRPPLPADVLVVGDSFTFGEQVSDNETWPACLERKLGRGVDNGGVSGYGTAQALRRASLKLAEKSYTTLVLSTLVDPVDGDFGRDILSFHNGFPKPAVIHGKNGPRPGENKVARATFG